MERIATRLLERGQSEGRNPHYSHGMRREGASGQREEHELWVDSEQEMLRKEERWKRQEGLIVEERIVLI